MTPAMLGSLGERLKNETIQFIQIKFFKVLLVEHQVGYSKVEALRVQSIKHVCMVLKSLKMVVGDKIWKKTELDMQVVKSVIEMLVEKTAV